MNREPRSLKTHILEQETQVSNRTPANNVQAPDFDCQHHRQKINYTVV